MTAFLVVLIVAVCGVGLYLLWKAGDAHDARPVDPEHEFRAAADLHRIRRRLDVADLRHRQRRDAARLKREISDALADDDS